MREWPSIVPGTPEDSYIVVSHYDRFGTAFAETDLDRANYETTIADLMSGQHSDPLRVVMFNLRPTEQRMSRTRSLRKYCAASALKGGSAGGLHRSPCRSRPPADEAGADMIAGLSSVHRFRSGDRRLQEQIIRLQEQIIAPTVVTQHSPPAAGLAAGDFTIQQPRHRRRAGHWRSVRRLGAFNGSAW